MIPQHDIFRNAGESAAPFLFVVQHSFHASLPTSLVAPVMALPPSKVISKLDVPITLNGQGMHIRIYQMAAIPTSRLRTFVENRSDLHDDVIAAMDLLISGF